MKFYNLDVIISVGYRVKSIQGTRFRQWATERLNESIVKGFTMDDERLKNLGGGNYWKELLDRIRACHEKINKKKENLARDRHAYRKECVPIFVNQSILYSKSRSIHLLMLFSLVSSETISEGYLGHLMLGYR